MSGSIQVPLARLSDADRKYAFWQRKSLGLKPNGEATVTKDGPKWILNSQIVVGLPAGTSRWVVRSNNPAVFVASTMSSALNVDCLPFIEGRQRRVLLINDALEECRLALKDLGATITEEPEKATDPPSRYNGRFAATSKDGMELECRLQVRFDLEGCIIFRAVGSKSFVDGAMAEADAMRYLKSSQPEPRESAASPGQTSLPADKEKSVKEFVQKIKKLLRENDNKSFIQAIADPEELKQMLASRTLDEIAEGFARSNKAKLEALLEQIDWTTAQYNASTNEVTVRIKSERPMVFVEKAGGWRLRN